MPKRGLGIDVLTAARQRVRRIFAEFPNVYVSFSGGKDSVPGTSRTWWRVDGVCHRLTFDEVFARGIWRLASVDEEGREVWAPTTKVEVFSAEPEQITGSVGFAPVRWLQRHRWDGDLLTFDLTRGQSVTTTPDHSVMRVRLGSRRNVKQALAEPVSARSIRTGDQFFSVTGPTDDAGWRDVDVPDWLLYLAGLWLADGCYATNRKIIIATGGSEAILERLRRIPRPERPSVLAASEVRAAVATGAVQEHAIRDAVRKYGLTRSAVVNQLYHPSRESSEYLPIRVLPSGDAWIHSKALVERMRALGLEGTSHTKSVPAWVMTAPAKQVAQFVAGYWDGDGCFGRIYRSSSVSEGISRDIRALLGRLGICSGLSVTTRRSSYGTCKSWVVSVPRSAAQRQFRDVVVTARKPKREPGNPAGEHPSYGMQVSAVKEIRPSHYTGWVYDVEVDQTHTFVADDVLVHNSGVAYELAAQEARRLGRTLGVLIVDLEAQYSHTIDYLYTMLKRHEDVSEVYWVALPLSLRNAVSQFEPKWQCWDPDAKDRWVRPLPEHPGVISDPGFFPFFRCGMEFEELVPEFAEWYSQTHGGRLTAALVAIRSDESLNRFRTIARRNKHMYDDLQWTTWVGGPCYNAYPIYDWRTEDDWRFYGRERVPYNKIYDLMHQAGVSIHASRLCQPYGDDQRKGLWLYHILEPETWTRIVARVSGANFGARYARETGNVLGRIKVAKPGGMSWQDYSLALLEMMPPATAEAFWTRISWFITWHVKNTPACAYGEIPDDGPVDRKHPSWHRICKVILSYDYYCRALTFSAPKDNKAWGVYLKKRDILRREVAQMLDGGRVEP